MKKTILCVGVLMCGAMWSCSSDEPAGSNQNPTNEIRVVTDVLPLSRAGHSTETLREFGLTIARGDEAEYANKHMTGGAVEGWNTDESMYWTSRKDGHTVVAYAPYVEGALDHKSIIDVKVAEDQTTEDAVKASDFIAMKKTDFVPDNDLDNGNLVVSMSHMLSKVYVELTYPDTYGQDGVNPVTDMAVGGMLTAAKFDFGAFDGQNSTLSLNANAAPTEIRPLATAHEGLAVRYEFIAIPQAQSQVAMTFKIGGTPYVWNYTGLNLEGGKAYTIKLTVDKTGVNLGGDVNVNEWENGEEISGNPEEGAEPYTIQEITDGKSAWSWVYGTVEMGYGRLAALYDNDGTTGWFSHWSYEDVEGNMTMSFDAGHAQCVIDMGEKNWIAGAGIRTSWADVLPKHVDIYVTSDEIPADVITDTDRAKLCDDGVNFSFNETEYTEYLTRMREADARFNWVKVAGIDVNPGETQRDFMVDFDAEQLAAKTVGRYIKLDVEYWPLHGEGYDKMCRAQICELYVKKVVKQNGQQVTL